MVSDAQKRATTKFEANNYDKICLRLPKGVREEWKAAAEREGKSLNAFIVDCVEEHLPAQK